MDGQDAALDAALKSMGLNRFEIPAPRPNGFVNLFQVLEGRCYQRLTDMSDDYAMPGGVAFGFAEHREFNAFAQRADKDVVCLYTAAVRITWSLFNAMMTIREVFPWVDDVERLGEEAGATPPPKGDLFFLLPPGSVSAEAEPIRRKLAAALFESAIDFMLMHEVGHLWNGHVEYLHQKSGPQPLQEMHLGQDPKLDITLAQALEFDADAFAIQKVFARAHRENPFAAFSTGLLKDHHVPGDGAHTATWYFTWFAIYSIFRLFDEACAVMEVPVRTHPPAALRQACLLTTVATVCKRQGWSELSMDSWASLASDAGLEAETAICRLRRMGLNSELFSEAWSGLAFDQIQRYLETWDTLGPQLATLRHGALPIAS